MADRGAYPDYISPVPQAETTQRIAGRPLVKTVLQSLPLHPKMPHDVFISHASEDKTIADMVCATLEQQGIRCWIAPRDIQPGVDWRAAIVAAIKSSRCMVLVFSDKANASSHIPRELDLAFDGEIPVVPFGSSR